VTTYWLHYIEGDPVLVACLCGRAYPIKRKDRFAPIDLDAGDGTTPCPVCATIRNARNQGTAVPPPPIPIEPILFQVLLTVGPPP
jgi:hypothetical protein